MVMDKQIELSRVIEEFIITEICSELGLDVQSIGDNEALIDSGIIDSLGILKILSFLDEELDIDISSTEINPDHFINIKSICEMIEKHTANS